MEGDSLPYSTRPTATLLRIHRRSSPPLFNPVALIVLVPILALIVIFLVIPSFISQASNIIKPISFKRGWDSLNILLVLLAILCGVLGKRSDEASVPEEDASPVKSRPLESNPWYDYGGSGLRRSSSSYPDLRQVREWETGHDQFRFFDDFELNKCGRSSPPPPVPPQEYDFRRARRSETDNSDVKVIPVDTFEVVRSTSVSEDSTQQRSFRSLPKHIDTEKDKIQPEDTNTPSPRPPVEKRMSGSDPKKSCSAIDDSIDSEKKRKRRQRIRRNHEKPEQSPPAPPPPPRQRSFPPPTPPPQPPPPPPSSFYNIFKNKKGNKNKKVHSLSGQPPPPSPPPLPPSPRSVFNNMFKSGSKSKRFQNSSASAPPPPPPPPPPSSIFNNIFKSGSKSKRFRNQSSSVPPPPPPPPSSIFVNMFKSGSKSKRFNSAPTPPPPRQQASIFSGRPPLPEKKRSFHLSEIPEPPPLPPFRMRETSFAPRGDFVRIRSAHSSPELEDVDLASVKGTPDRTDGGDDLGSSVTLQDVDLPSAKDTPDMMDGGHGLGRPVACPSPDVNMKADSFIARLKSEWRLEKMNSIGKGT